MAQNTALMKHTHPNGDITVTDTVNGTKEFYTKAQWEKGNVDGDKFGKPNDKDDSKRKR
jgi:hypothetical protein